MLSLGGTVLNHHRHARGACGFSCLGRVPCRRGPATQEPERQRSLYRARVCVEFLHNWHYTWRVIPTFDHSVDHVVKGGSKISESMMRLDGVDPFFVGREGWCCCFEGWLRYPLDIQVVFVVGWPSMSHKKSHSLQFRLQPAVPSKVLFSARCCKWPPYPLGKPIQKLQASRETCRRDVLPHEILHPER